MLPIEPTPNLMERYPDLRRIQFTSPAGVPEEEVGTLVALGGSVIGGIFDGGPIIRTFWKPSAEEITALVNGAVIEMDIYDSGMAPMALNVEVDV